MRYPLFDWIRGIAAIGIVGCHLNLAPRSEGASLLLHFTDLNVGVFGLLSGFLLAASCEGGDVRGAGRAWRVVGRRCGRILPVYLFWSTLYVIFSLSIAMVRDGRLPARVHSWVYWSSVLFNGGASCHLWYLSALLYVSLIQVFLYVLLPQGRIWAITQISLSLGGICAATWIPGNIFFYTVRLLAFVSAGILVHHFMPSNPSVRRALACGGLALLMAGISFLPVWPHHFLPDYLLGILLFCALLAIRVPETRVGAWLGATSLAVFLVHPMLTAEMGMITKRLFPAPYGVSAILFSWGLSYLMALFLATVMIRIPRLSRIVR